MAKNLSTSNKRAALVEADELLDGAVGTAGDPQPGRKWIRILKFICQMLLTILTAAGTAFGMESFTLI